MKWTVSGAVFCLCLAGGPLGSAQAQGTSAPSDYSALTALSAALAPPDKAHAQHLFATGFSLWQSGDFGAAELAFKQGLDIDPANALANYYYGDCLARRKDKAEARDYLARAAALGNGSAESFKAQAELQALSAMQTSTADMSDGELKDAFAGNWQLEIVDPSAHGAFSISRLPDSSMSISGKWYMDKFSRVILRGDHITMIGGAWGTNMQFDGRLTSPTHMEGHVSDWGGHGSNWFADKN